MAAEVTQEVKVTMIVQTGSSTFLQITRCASENIAVAFDGALRAQEEIIRPALAKQDQLRVKGAPNA